MTNVRLYKNGVFTVKNTTVRIDTIRGCLASLEEMVELIDRMSVIRLSDSEILDVRAKRLYIINDQQRKDYMAGKTVRLYPIKQTHEQIIKLLEESQC